MPPVLLDGVLHRKNATWENGKNKEQRHASLHSLQFAFVVLGSGPGLLHARQVLHSMTYLILIVLVLTGYNCEAGCYEKRPLPEGQRVLCTVFGSVYVVCVVCVLCGLCVCMYV